MSGVLIVFPAYAGMIRDATTIHWATPSVPRIRGDDPIIQGFLLWSEVCSPHTRG